MLRTIAFNYFVSSLQELHFQKISQYTEGLDAYEAFCLPYLITPNGELLSWDKSRLKAAFYEKARRDMEELLKHKNFINNLDSSKAIDFDEIGVLAENRNIESESHHQVGNISITITHRNNNPDFPESLFAGHMEIACIIVEIEDYEH